MYAITALARYLEQGQTDKLFAFRLNQDYQSSIAFKEATAEKYLKIGISQSTTGTLHIHVPHAEQEKAKHHTAAHHHSHHPQAQDSTSFEITNARYNNNQLTVFLNNEKVEATIAHVNDSYFVFCATTGENYQFQAEKATIGADAAQDDGVHASLKVNLYC